MTFYCFVWRCWDPAHCFCRTLVFAFILVRNLDLFVYRDGSSTNKRVILGTEQLTKCFEPLRFLQVKVKTDLNPSVVNSRPFQDLLWLSDACFDVSLSVSVQFLNCSVNRFKPPPPVIHY